MNSRRSRSLDHLVGAGEQRRRHLDPERSRRSHHFNIAQSLALKPPARLNPIKVAVDVELQEDRWMIARPASCLGSNPVKSQFRQIKLINKDIDHPNRIVLIDPVFQAFGKQCALLAIRALNEALHPTLRRSQESALRESHEGGRFHTARVRPGHSAMSARCPVCPKPDMAGRFMSTRPRSSVKPDRSMT